MATLLCHIEINPGKEQEFEAVMKEMYRRTHAEEPNCVRYEYYRAAKANCYYALLSFTDRFAFLQHQISDYHEGFDFAALLKAIELEWVDPVTEASPLIPTHNSPLPDDASEAIKAAADMYVLAVQDWWQEHRK